MSTPNELLREMRFVTSRQDVPWFGKLDTECMAGNLPDDYANAFIRACLLIGLPEGFDIGDEATATLAVELVAKDRRITELEAERDDARKRLKMSVDLRTIDTAGYGNEIAQLRKALADVIEEAEEEPGRSSPAVVHGRAVLDGGALRLATEELNRDYPLPRCKHGSALRDHAGETLVPPCGCSIDAGEGE